MVTLTLPLAAGQQGPWSKYAKAQDSAQPAQPSGPWSKYQAPAAQPAPVTASGRKPGDPGYDPLEQTYEPGTEPEEDISYLWADQPTGRGDRTTVMDRVGDAVEDIAAPLTGNANEGVRGATNFVGGMADGLRRWATETMVQDPAKGLAEADRALNPGTMFIHGNMATAEAIDAARGGDFSTAGKKALEAVPDLSGAALSVVPGAGATKAAGAAKAAGRVGAGEVARTMTAKAIIEGGTRPQAVDRWRAVLFNSGVPRDVIDRRIQNAIDAYDDPLAGGTARQLTFAQLLQAELLREGAEKFPTAAENVEKVLRSFELSTKKGREAGNIVRSGADQMRSDQSDFLRGSARRNLGDTPRTGIRADMEAQLKEIGTEGYEPILSQPIGAGRQQRIWDVLRGPGMNEFGSVARRIAAGEGIDLRAFIEMEPVKAAHWMQHTARQLAEEHAGTALGNSYNALRERILATIDDLPGPGGSTYRDWRLHYADTAGIGDELNAGNRFGAAIANPGDADDFVNGFNALTKDQQAARLASIRDWVEARLGGGPEDAPARIALLEKQAVIDTLERLGPGGKALADDIRAVRSENKFLGGVSNRGQSATAPNSDIMAEAPNLYSSKLASSVPASMAADGAAMAMGLTTVPLLTAIRLGPKALSSVLRPREATLTDMARIGMARQKNAFDAPPRPTTAETVRPTGRGRINSFSDDTVEASAPGVSSNAFDETPDRAGASGVLAQGAAGSAGGSVFGSQVDLTGDGEIDWRDALAGAAGGAAGVVGGARWLGRKSGERSAARRNAFDPDQQGGTLDLRPENRVFGPGSPDDLGFYTSAERALANPPPRFKDAKSLTADQWRAYFRDAGVSKEGFEYQVDAALKSIGAGNGQRIPKSQVEEALARARPQAYAAGTTVDAVPSKVLDRAETYDIYGKDSKRLKLVERERKRLGMRDGQEFETNYSQYVAPGKHSNYDQELIVMPGLDYQSHNWKTPGALGHLRTTQRKTANGEKVLHVEELQSDLHQEGARYGYQGAGHMGPDIKSMQAARDAAQDRYQEIRMNLGDRGSVPRLYEVPSMELDEIERAIADPTLREVAKEYQVAHRRLAKAVFSDEANMPPRAPLENWEGIFIERALYKAAQEGHDLVTFPVGRSLHEGVGTEGTKRFYDERLPKHLQSVARKLGLKVERVQMDFDNALKVDRGISAEHAVVDGKGNILKEFDSLPEARAYIEDRLSIATVPALRLTPQARNELSKGVQVMGGVGMAGAAGGTMFAEQLDAQ